MTTVERRQAARTNLEKLAYIHIEPNNGAIVLKPAAVIPREDVWAYRPEHLARLQEALDQAHAGQVLNLSQQQLERLLDQSRG